MSEALRIANVVANPLTCTKVHDSIIALPCSHLEEDGQCAGLFELHVGAMLPGQDWSSVLVCFPLPSCF